MKIHINHKRVGDTYTHKVGMHLQFLKFRERLLSVFLYCERKSIISLIDKN